MYVCGGWLAMKAPCCRHEWTKVQNQSSLESWVYMNPEADSNKKGIHYAAGSIIVAISIVFWIHSAQRCEWRPSVDRLKLVLNGSYMHMMCHQLLNGTVDASSEDSAAPKPKQSERFKRHAKAASQLLAEIWWCLFSPELDCICRTRLNDHFPNSVNPLIVHAIDETQQRSSRFSALESSVAAAAI